MYGLIGIFPFPNLLFMVLLCEYFKGGNDHMVAQPIIFDGEPKWEVDGILCYCIARGTT